MTGPELSEAPEMLGPDLDRQRWLEWRRGGIGSSDAAAIAGLDPWKGPMSIWLEKTGRLPARADQPEWQKWGRLLEPAIASEFEQRVNLSVGPAQVTAEHPERPWMRATIDNFVFEGPAGDVPPMGLLEIKTAAAFKADQWEDGAIPEHVQLQVQHQLAVTGLGQAWIAALVGGQRLELREVLRDEETISALMRLEGIFWKRVLDDDPPAGDGRDQSTKDLRRAFWAAEPEGVDLEEDALALIADLRAAKAEAKACERRIATAEQTLMARLQEATVGRIFGEQVVSWKRYERASIDVERLRSEHPRLAARLTVKSGYRVLRLAGAREEV